MIAAKGCDYVQPTLAQVPLRLDMPPNIFSFWILDLTDHAKLNQSNPVLISSSKEDTYLHETQNGAYSEGKVCRLITCFSL